MRFILIKRSKNLIIVFYCTSEIQNENFELGDIQCLFRDKLNFPEIKFLWVLYCRMSLESFIQKKEKT